MSPPQQLRQRTSCCSSLPIYRSWKDERLSWRSWLTCSGWFTHISGHPSATGRSQDSESTPAKDRRSTAGPRNQPESTRETKHANVYCVIEVWDAAVTWSLINIIYKDVQPSELYQFVFVLCIIMPALCRPLYFCPVVCFFLSFFFFFFVLVLHLILLCSRFRVLN